MSSLDVEGLFKKFTITEISDIEKKLKSDVERKKEDLRQMVGRRYRDIIDAADNIRTMKESSDSILVVIRRVQQSFDSLQEIQQKVVSAQARARNITQCEYLSQAATTRLYLELYRDLSEMLWDCLDENLLLEAAWLFMFGFWLHGQLLTFNITEEQKSAVNGQYNHLLPFKDRIIHMIHDRFE